MKTSVQTQTMLLREPEVQPTKEVLKNALGGSYLLYEKLMEILVSLAISPEWNYYKDGKAWLCKAIYRKKTIFWLSVWKDSFRITFYFTAKNCSGISGLDIDENIKKDFYEHNSLGKFMPLTINVVTDNEQLTNIFKIIDYKKSLK